MPARIVTDKAFSFVWNHASSAEEAAEVLDMKIDTARHRAVVLRRQGVFMKDMRNPDIDITDLAPVALAAMGVKGTGFAPTQREFVLIWQLSRSISEVSQRAGIESGPCRTRAKVYRQAGVPLKRLRRPRLNQDQETRKSRVVSASELTADDLTAIHYA